MPTKQLTCALFLSFLVACDEQASRVADAGKPGATDGGGAAASPDSGPQTAVADAGAGGAMDASNATPFDMLVIPNVPSPMPPPAFCDGLLPTGAPGEWQSQVVNYVGNRLNYAVDAEQNRIPDFSYAGYRYGIEPLPEAPVVEMVAPADGDDTARIQAALDLVGQRPLGPDGLRGAVLLAPGTYRVEGVLNVNRSGVVLRGAGDGADPAADTILHAVGNTPDQRTVVVVGSGRETRWADEVPNTRRDIITPFVPVGAMGFEVADATPYQVGQNIVIDHPDTQAWLDARNGGDTAGDVPWQVGEIPILYNRRITAIAGNILRLDAPVFDHLDRSLSTASVYVTSRNDILTNVGLESLRIDIETTGRTDEKHAWNAVGLIGVEDAWVRDVTALRFGLSGVRMATASRVTVQNVRALDPASQDTGGRRYNFNAERATGLALVRDCVASDGRHHFVSNGISLVSGVVFFRCESQRARTSSEGHRRWSQGLLFDSIRETETFNKRLLGLYNRGSYGTGHGWAAAHSVAWNYDLGQNGSAVIQKPPRAQNYAVGGAGNFDGSPPFFPRMSGPAAWAGWVETPPAPPEPPPGSMEPPPGSMAPPGSMDPPMTDPPPAPMPVEPPPVRLVPSSLYEAQLCDRLRP